MNSPGYHRFHIPVMGLAYTIDSPVKVARFGISSVISIIENRLIEMMRKHYYTFSGKDFFPISSNEKDFRARRVTDYLNLVNSIVESQVQELRRSAFEKGSEIVKYFEMLPDDSTVKELYYKMTKTTNAAERKKLEDHLRTQIRPGSIDVNIMTKTDRNNYGKNGELLAEGSDAIAALRGYEKSELKNSSVIFSAGTNLRLFNYLENCTSFQVNENGIFAKKVVIKVSDYRSALIQGKYLAKKGIWVSEFRIESGLNCGGHAFATDGYLLGPILDEFTKKRQELTNALFDIYNKALIEKHNRRLLYPPKISLSVQGGIGTHIEDEFLHQYYKIDSTGWGTPFLLVPEATTVDKETMDILCKAKEEDVILSKNSPLGVRFHYLKGTSSEKEKLARISSGKPGSPCTEKHLAFNTEFTEEPICTASRKYQKLKIAQLQSLGLPEPVYERQLSEILDKECLCIGLSNAAAINYSQTMIKKLTAVTICPGPNVVNFSQTVSLQTMVGHIYGRENIISNEGRPHMFIAELNLYVSYLEEQLEDAANEQGEARPIKYYVSFYQNLRNGISYYHNLPQLLHTAGDQFILALRIAESKLDALSVQYPLLEQ